MNAPVLFRKAAERDLEAIEDWYETQRKDLGLEFRAVVDTAVAQISIQPFLCQARYRALRRVILRRFPYALWYRVQGDVIIVVACIHGRRGRNYFKKRLGSA